MRAWRAIGTAAAVLLMVVAVAGAQAEEPAALATYDYFVPPEPLRRQTPQMEARYCTAATVPVLR